MDIAEDMYRDELLEHYRNPQNRGRIAKADVKYRDFNPICGDEIEIFIKTRKGRIDEIKFSGKGCAISQAAASILTGQIKGKTLQYVKKISNGQMLEMIPVKVSHLRIKCGLLALKAAKKGIIIHEGRNQNE